MKQVEAGNRTVPPQHTGSKHNTEYAITCPTVEACIQRFNVAKERLLEVNRWHQLGGSLSANFTLTDRQGQVLYHKAEEGDHIRIDLPGPGSKDGNGYDWVEIEKIEDRSTRSGNCAYVALRVRPSSNPRQLQGKVAHFYNPEATSSFVIERVGNSIKASVYGRNEKPNEQPDDLLDKIRNWMVALTAAMGFSKPQWKALVKGLLK